MLCIADHMDSVVLFVAGDIIALNEFLTQATIKANVFSIAVTATHASILHGCTKPRAKIPFLSRLTLPTFLLRRC